MPTIQHTPIHDETVPLESPAADFDINLLRAKFAALMERAAHAVQLAGYEQDDAVIDRWLICRYAGADPVEIPADWLSDANLLREQIVSTMSKAAATTLHPHDIRIVALRLSATLERWA